MAAYSDFGYHTGDEVFVLFCSGSIESHIGAKGTLDFFDGTNFRVKLPNGDTCDASEIKAANAMNRITLTETQKKNLSVDAQALVEAGYYTADLRVMYNQHFMDFLVAKFETDYAKKAKQELAADDAKKVAETTKK